MVMWGTLIYFSFFNLFVLSRVRGSGKNNGFWIGWLDLLTPHCTVSLYITINTGLPLIYSLHITRACHPFPENGFITQKLALQIDMKSSCHIFFSDLGMSTLQNWTQFYNSNSTVSVVLGSVLPLAANTHSLYRRGTDDAGNTALLLLRGADNIKTLLL
jgi:hypothetical protein